MSITDKINHDVEEEHNEYDNDDDTLACVRRFLRLLHRVSVMELDNVTLSRPIIVIIIITMPQEAVQQKKY